MINSTMLYAMESLFVQQSYHTSLHLQRPQSLASHHLVSNHVEHYNELTPSYARSPSPRLIRLVALWPSRTRRLGA
jgi:hypothetical protein